MLEMYMPVNKIITWKDNCIFTEKFFKVIKYIDI